MKTNFKLIGGFGIAEKEIKKRQVEIKNIIDKYYEVGIREFFIGYNPPYWHNVFGFELSPNGRFGENEQITSYETFKSAVEYVHSLGCEIFLTVNFRYYSDITFPYVKKIIDEVVNAGINGLIVGAPEILEYLAEIKFKGKINVSTILSIFNSDAILFFISYFKEKGLKFNRLILPREVTMLEIENIANSFSDLDIEIFGHGDYCRYSNGLCLAEHKYFSRDLCGFVIKHGLEIKKTIKYDFKQIILDNSLSDLEKENLIDNNLNGLEYIFTCQNIFDSNKLNYIINEYILNFQNQFYGKLGEAEIKDTANQIYRLMGKELFMNFSKYIYDGLRPIQDNHNNFIISFLSLYNLIIVYINDKNPKIELIIDKILKIKEKCINYFEKQKSIKGNFGLETYYKFMLYNRTSVPFYNYINNIKNIKIVKIPLRGRDLTVFKLGINLIEDATYNPEKYIDEGTITGKYFHYDPSKLKLYQEKINEIINLH